MSAMSQFTRFFPGKFQYFGKCAGVKHLTIIVLEYSKFILHWQVMSLFNREVVWLSKEYRLARHDICQMFYTSTVSQILKFTWENARKSRHFRLLIWNFGIFIHIIWLISQFSSIYAHFILNLWLKWLKILKQNSMILIELWNLTRV